MLDLIGFFSKPLLSRQTLMGRTLSSTFIDLSNRTLYDILMEYLVPLPQDRALVIGVGNGELLKRIAARTDSESLVGVDSDVRRLKATRRKIKGRIKSEHLVLVTEDSVRLPLAEEQFTKVIVADFIPVSPDARAADVASFSQELFRVLRVGGVAVLGFEIDNENRLLFSNRGIRSDQVLYTEDLRHHLSTVGFQEVHLVGASYSGRSYCIALGRKEKRHKTCC